MWRDDKPFELLYNREEDAESRQAAHLCNFTRRCLIKSFPSFREPPESLPEPISDSIAPVETSRNIVTFDIISSIAKKNQIKSALLAPRSIAKYFSSTDLRSPTAANLQMLHDLQEALHASQSVVVFQPDHLAPLLALGAHNPVFLPMPTMRHDPARGKSHDLLIINHQRDRKSLNHLNALLAANHQISASIVDCTSFHTPDAAADAKFHIHIGAPPQEQTGFRIVDSHAQRALVIHLDDAGSRPAGTNLVQHNISGLRVSRVKDVIPAVQSLATDAAMADLFKRNGDRIAAAFNGTIEEKLLSMMK